MSEFGLLLAELIGRDENFLGAIVTDDEGNPVDYARRPDGISALDLQIVGAQVECCMTPLDKACARLSDGPCTVVAVEASHGTLLATTVAEIFVMVATAKASPDLPRLLREFSGVARELTVLLES